MSEFIDELKVRAEGGCADAMYELGEHYRKAIYVKQDKNKSFYWYNNAYKNGSVSAIFSLGVCFLLGYGVKKDGVKGEELIKQYSTRAWG